MKIIFLDIDGVLNSHRSMLAKVGQLGNVPVAHADARRFAELQAKFIDPVAVAMLNRLTSADPGIKLVISSTHRFFAFRGGELNLSCLQDYMTLLGVAGPVVGATPITDGPRGAEIAQWLRLNEHLPIDSYVIVDDDDDMLPAQMSHLELVDGEVGLNVSNVLGIQRRLGITDEQLYRAQ